MYNTAIKRCRGSTTGYLNRVTMKRVAFFSDNVIIQVSYSRSWSLVRNVIMDCEAPRVCRPAHQHSSDGT